MKRLVQFFLRNVLTNFLAIVLLCLTVASGEELSQDVIQVDFQVDELVYDNLDFPLSLIRNNTVSYSSLQRIADVVPFSIDFGRKTVNLFSDAKLNQLSYTLLHPLISNLVKVVICKNAP